MKKDHLVWITLLSLFVFHLINNMMIIFRDTTPFIADAADYYQSGFFYWKTWMEFVKQWDFSLLHSVMSKTLGGQLIALLTIPFFSVFGVSHEVAILANQTFFVVLILSIFGLGKVLFNRRTGLMAAFLITFYPGVMGFSRVYMLEFPILAISVVCVYLLARSEGFKKFRYSLGFGFAFALGELLRPRFVIFIIIPILFYILKNIAMLFREEKSSAGISAAKMAVNILFSVAFSCLILFPWWSESSFSSYLETQKLWFSWPALSNISFTLPYYLQVLSEVHLGWFFLFLFILGSIVSLFEKNKRSNICFLFLWFAFTFVLVSMFGLKEYPRVVIPLLAPLALISAAGMEGLSRLKGGRYLLIAFLVLGVSQYFFISYGDKTVKEADPGEYFRDMRSRGLLHARSQSYDWNRAELLQIFKERRNSDKTWGWGSINNSSRHLVNGLFRPITNDLIKVLDIDFRGTTTHIEMEERILTDSLPIAIMGFYGDEFNCKTLFSDQEFQHMVLGADYVIVHETKGSQGSFIDTIRGIFNAHISQFEKLKVMMTPWGEISVYGKKKEDLGGSRSSKVQERSVL